MDWLKRSQTIKQKKPTGNATPLYMTESLASALLLQGDLGRIVAKPKYVDHNEWLAAATFDFFNNVNLFFGTISESCTAKDCPVMSAGPCFEYLWAVSDKKIQQVTAAQYVDYVMTWLNSQLADENVFPTRAGIEFPKTFPDTVKLAFKRLFRIFAHIFHAHYDRIVALQLQAHLNSLFIHFVSFALEFDLIERKELAPMSDLLGAYASRGVLRPELLKEKS